VALVLLCSGLAAACRAAGPAAPAALPADVLAEVRETGPLAKGRFVAERKWLAAEQGVGHLTGRAAADGAAKNGTAWEVRADAAKAGTALFGPYLELPPGDYLTLFRVRLVPAPDGDNGDSLGTFDACVGFGNEILASRELTESDLFPRRYTVVPLPFHYGGGKLECRFQWSGCGGLRLDQVALFRIVGGMAVESIGRVAPPVPSGRPCELPYHSEPRPFADIFPRSAAPATTLLVLDLRKELPDVRLATHCLQGLVNRIQPRIYCYTGDTDVFWLDQMVRRHRIEKIETVATPAALLARFRGVVRGMVVADPRLPATRNVATMIAAVRDGLAVSPRLAKQWPLPVLDDLRGRWTTSAAAYRWAFDNLWDRLNHHVIACSWPDALALRDYLVENKVFIFWLSGSLDGARAYSDANGELHMMEELFARMPANIPVMSYPWAGKDVGIGEGPGVSLFAEFGKYLVGTIDCANLSVHSGLRIGPLRQQPAPDAPPLRRDKVYLSIVMSDGDNLPVLTNGNFPQLWKDPARGHVPVGWTMSPAAAVLAPDVVDYYYGAATPEDYFLAAVSGVGYTYPDLYGARYRRGDRQRVYDEFLNQTRQYMDLCGLKGIWIMNASLPEVIGRYAQQIPRLEAIFPDYGRVRTDPQALTYPTAENVPVFHAATTWQETDSREDRIARLVADIRDMTPAERPAFLHLFALNWFCDVSLLREAVARLGDDYLAVRPDHLASLYRRYIAREQVLLTVKRRLPCIEGQPIVLEPALHNATDRPQEVNLRVRAGLEETAISPPTAAIPAAGEITVRVTGQPTGDKIELQVEGTFGRHAATVALQKTPLAELTGPLPSGVNLCPAGFFEAYALAHRVGEKVADAGAAGGIAWAAIKGKTEAGQLTFGPYCPLPKGRYVALFRLKRTSAGTGLLAQLDTCVGGGSPQTGLADIAAERLPLNEFRSVPIVFAHPGGTLECRVYWYGAASLSVDGIGLWRLTDRG
jgi:hypothetical protein